jgi:hypothetical protein
MDLGLVGRLAVGAVLLVVGYGEYRRGRHGMVMIYVGMVLTTVFGYVYHAPLLIAGIVLMLVGGWITWLRKSESGSTG